MNAVAKVAALPAVLRPQNLTELTTFAQMAARSSMVPRDYAGKPENVMVAIQMGSEIGLAPMQALQNISVINGRPAVWGDAMLGLCRQSPLCEDIEERTEGDGDKTVAICIAKRAGGKKPVEARFSVEDARKAGLWNKAGPWQQYPKRMLQMRARGFALRDAFPDVLRGLVSAEEATDTPAEAFAGQTIEAEPAQRQPQPATDPAPRQAATDAPSEPAPPPRRTARQVMQEIIDRYSSLQTRQEYLLATDELRARVDWFRQQQPEAANLIVNAMSAAWARTAEPEPVDAEAEMEAYEAGETDLPEVEIAGAEKVMAG